MTRYRIMLDSADLGGVHMPRSVWDLLRPVGSDVAVGLGRAPPRRRTRRHTSSATPSGHRGARHLSARHARAAAHALPRRGSAPAGARLDAGRVVAYGNLYTVWRDEARREIRLDRPHIRRAVSLEYCLGRRSCGCWTKADLLSGRRMMTVNMRPCYAWARTCWRWRCRGPRRATGERPCFRQRRTPNARPWA